MMTKPTHEGWYWAREHEGGSWDPTCVVIYGSGGWASGQLVWLRPGEDGAQSLDDIAEWGELIRESTDGT